MFSAPLDGDLLCAVDEIGKFASWVCGVGNRKGLIFAKTRSHRTLKPSVGQ